MPIDILKLRQLQSQHKRLLLPLRAEPSHRHVTHLQLHVVLMGTHRGILGIPVLLTSLCQLVAYRFRRLTDIFHHPLLTPVGNPCEILVKQRLETTEEILPAAVQQLAMTHQLFIPDGNRLLVPVPVLVKTLQQTIALLQGFLVLQQMIKIALIRLRNNTIDKLAARITPSEYDILVIGGNHHQWHPSDMLTKRLTHLLVPSHLLGLSHALDTGNRHRLSIHLILAVDCKKLLSTTDILRIDTIKATFAKREVIDCIQQIRLTHTVVTNQAVDIGAEVHINIGVGFKIAQFKIRQIHIYTL